VRGPITSLIGYIPDDTYHCDGRVRDYYILRKGNRILTADVEFDIPSELDRVLILTPGNNKLVCHVLMITLRQGIAIKVDDEDPTKYTRVGYVDIPGYYWSEIYGGAITVEDLSINDFPDVQSIILV
jgi:hypothetical protein